MQTKYVLTLYLLMLLAGFAQAEYQEKVYSGWLHSGDNFTASGKSFTVDLDEFSEKISVSLNGYNLLIDKGYCEEIINLSICFNGMNVSYRNYTLHEDIYKANIAVYSLFANIEATMTIEDSELLIGERTDVNLVIENTGSIVANNIKYSDSFEGFDILTMDGCIIRNKIISWTGSLVPNRKKECSWNLEAVSGTTFISNSSITYFNGNIIKSVSPSMTSIKVKDYSLNILFNSSKDEPNVGDTVNLSIKLRDNHTTEKTSNIKFYLSIPSELSVIDEKGLNKQDNKYIWSGSLEPGEEKNLLILLRVERTGKHSLESYALFDVNGLTKRVDRTKEIEGNIDELDISFKIADKTLNPLEETNIKVFIVNPGKETLKSISASVYSDIEGVSIKQVDIEEIEGKSDYQLLDVDFVAPGMPAKYFIFANVTYETMFGQKIYSQATEEINVVTNQTLNESLNTSSTIEKVESLAGDSEEPIKEVEQIEEVKEETIKLSPLPKIKAVLTYNRVAFILVDILLVILIFFVFTRIKKSR